MATTDMHVLVFGLGYSGTAIALKARDHGFRVTVTTRTPSVATDRDGIEIVAFSAAGSAIREATHVVSTAGPDESGDPVMQMYAAVFADAPRLRWAGYISTIGVYGDRDGGWVDEDTDVAAASPRSARRLEAERAWTALATRVPVDLFRTAGIYGPGRSVIDDLRAGRGRRVNKPGHAFSRIHRDDIAAAVLAAMRQDRPPGVRVLHLADDEPAESAAVITEAAALLGVAPPPLVPYADIAPSMSPMARSFWAENRKVANAKTKAALGLAWRYPTYREGLRGILAEEGRDGPA